MGDGFGRSKAIGVSVALIALAATPAYCVQVNNGFLSFTYQQGASPPAPINVALTSVTGSFTVSIATNPVGWLAVSPAQGVGTTVLLVSIAPQNLAPGKYLGILTIKDGGALLGTATVQVDLTVKQGTTGGPVIGSFQSDGRIAHIADGGSWKTFVTVVNRKHPVNTWAWAKIE